jgi:hypothetical protein
MHQIGEFDTAAHDPPTTANLLAMQNYLSDLAAALSH